MQLETMWVHGLRRFGGDAPTKLRLDGHLVCLIGANEVGKSTLLDGLELAYIQPGDDPGDQPPVGLLDRTRGEDVSDDHEIVHLRYRLDDDDRALLDNLEGAQQVKDVRWFQRRKVAGGAVTTSLEPVPIRDKKSRRDGAAALREAMAADTWFSAESREGTPVDDANISNLLEHLESNYDSLSVLAELSALADYLDEFEMDALTTTLRQAIESESKPHPRDEAIHALAGRVPRFVRFDSAARDLADEYDLAAVIDDLPVALANLADLAGLDLRRLLQKISEGETGTVKDLIDEANSELRTRFAAWTQKPPVTVSVDTSDTRLYMHVKSGSGASMRIRERSDGLRQFVALVALTANQRHSVAPVLLIDEVEMNLHYDAQADLITVLTEQTTAAQVVYTTHSAASLPEDLGSAVRVIEGIDDRMASTVRQQFWSDSPGFGQLLLAMGAGSLAFVPLRPAIVVEGGADLVLLPTLIKEAIGSDMVGFQVVPGASNAPPKRLAGLDLHGVRTVWWLDGDEGGKDRRDFLVGEGVPATRILLMEAAGLPLDLEDLVHPDTYVRAVNLYGNDVGADDSFGLPDMPDETCSRHQAVEDWFAARDLVPPSKTAVANKVVGLRGDAMLVEPRRRTTLRSMHARAIALLSEDVQG